jgi:hypothetical protein
VVEHVAAAIGVDADVVARVAAVRTAKRYREYVRDFLGVRYEPAFVRKVAEEAVREAVTKKDNPAVLFNVALDELVCQGCELPGGTTLDALLPAQPCRRGRATEADLMNLSGHEDRHTLQRYLKPSKEGTHRRLDEIDAHRPTWTPSADELVARLTNH